MSVVLILSEVVTQEQRAEVLRVAQQYGSWVPLSETSYAVHTTLSPDQLGDTICRRVGVVEGLQILRVSRAQPGAVAAKARQRLGAEAVLADSFNQFGFSKGDRRK